MASKTTERMPSVKTICERLGVDATKAEEIRGVMSRKLSAFDYPSVVALVRSTPNHPAMTVLRLMAISDIIGAFGVEYLGDGVEYVNRGETYTPTVLYDHGFKVCCWGDLVERQPRRFA